MTASQKVFMLDVECPLGISAEAARRAGFMLPSDIPDCAIWKRDERGRFFFEWITLDFVIEGDGKVTFP